MLNFYNLSEIWDSNLQIELLIPHISNAKIVTHWKDAIGHLIAKSRKYPTHQKRLHLFGYEEPCLEHIEDVCRDCEIRVTFERVIKAEKILVAG